LVDVNEHLHFLNVNSRLYHVYNNDYPLGGFNDSGYGDRRFDPIADDKGQVIPSLYFAEHYIDAIAETLMRKASDGKRQFKGDLNKNGILQIDILRELTLLDVNQIPVVSALLEEGNNAYPELQNFAAWVAVNHAQIDGLSWYGYQRELPGQRCMMMFGDRVSDTDIKKRAVEPLLSITAKQKMMDASIALDCALPESLLL
jgi:hypothetical protein